MLRSSDLPLLMLQTLPDPQELPPGDAWRKSSFDCCCFGRHPHTGSESPGPRRRIPTTMMTQRTRPVLVTTPDHKRSMATARNSAEAVVAVGVVEASPGWIGAGGGVAGTSCGCVHCQAQAGACCPKKRGRTTKRMMLWAESIVAREAVDAACSVAAAALLAAEDAAGYSPAKIRRFGGPAEEVSRSWLQ